jgi:hypothetical protein
MNKRIISCFIVLFAVSFAAKGQRITYSEPERMDDRDINFDIIGKMNGNMLVYKNVRWKHAISIYTPEMELKERVALDFVPDRTFNVDFVTYPDFAFMIYQYQKKSIVYCMGVKIGPDGKTIGDPVQLDTTKIELAATNKIYTAINSENKQHIMIFKIYKKHEKYNFITLLFNDKLELKHKARKQVPFDDRKEVFSEFFIDNEGVFVFTKGTRSGNRDNIGALKLVTQQPASDTFTYRELKLQENYLDEIKLKIDNVNKQYLINSFYYKQRRGNIEGLYTTVWNKGADSSIASAFTELGDSVRFNAKAQGQLRYALNDFFIRQVIVKKDGSFLLTAEDYSTQSRGGFNNNGWNRWDYLNSPFMSPYDYYLYSPTYSSFYRPFNTFGGNQSTRYFYDKVLILSVDKGGNIDWSNVIHKDQFEDDNDNYLSYGTMNAAGEIHFFFNEQVRRNQIVSWQSISASGELRRNATLKSEGKGYQFMPRFMKQVGARQIIMPCTYRGNICFAKIDF